MKRSTTTPWMSADDYGRSLKGLTVNLLVRDIDAAMPFYREVLDATVVYADEDFAVLRRDPNHPFPKYRHDPQRGSRRNPDRDPAEVFLFRLRVTRQSVQPSPQALFILDIRDLDHPAQPRPALRSRSRSRIRA